jgi:hypothetical protein
VAAVAFPKALGLEMLAQGGLDYLAGHELLDGIARGVLAPSFGGAGEVGRAAKLGDAAPELGKL